MSFKRNTISVHITNSIAIRIGYEIFFDSSLHIGDRVCLTLNDETREVTLIENNFCGYKICRYHGVRSIYIRFPLRDKTKETQFYSFGSPKSDAIKQEQVTVNKNMICFKF